MSDFTDRVIDFIVEEYRDGKLTAEQVERLRVLFDPPGSTAERPVWGATTVKVPVVKVNQP